MPRIVRAVAAALVVLGTLVLAACHLPYHPLPGQEPFVYTPVPGGTR
ncbi:MAG TPA: hypothetical protein VMB34_14870 [Acetobacteraceae bacterium]|nr:hypothetical protein [Acetobacteraceae bacterium]